MTGEQVRAAVTAGPDMRRTGEDVRKSARVVMPQRKERVTTRLAADLLARFRRQRGYRARIHAILHAYMEAHARNE